MVYHTIIIHYYYMLVHTAYCVNVLVFIKVLKKERSRSLRQRGSGNK